MGHKFPTYEQMQQLVVEKLATVSVNGYLDTFKYARRVMFDYLWDTNELLHECRGITYDNRTGELVVAAPRKSFNYLENGWWKDKPLDTPVIACKKYNGFMACVSKHEDEIIVSTTGSTKSDFVEYAKEFLLQKSFDWMHEHNTLLFEIVHPDDPHIVKEPVGAHYLGYRHKPDGHFSPYGKSEDIYVGTLKGILAIAEVNTGEGFMVYDIHNDPDGLQPAKIKTPYYVGKKKLMRMSQRSSNLMYSNTEGYSMTLPRMWRDIPKIITENYSMESWNNFDEDFRRWFLEQLKGH